MSAERIPHVPVPDGRPATTIVMLRDLRKELRRHTPQGIPTVREMVCEMGRDKPIELDLTDVDESARELPKVVPPNRRA